MDSSAPNPQQNGLQLPDTRSNDQQRSPIPPSTTGEEIESLKIEEDRDIFAWLKLARSLPLKSERSSNLACLTSTQLRAIYILRHCHNGDVGALMRQVRTSSTSNQASTAGQ